jgi:hypothetical protein
MGRAALRTPAQGARIVAAVTAAAVDYALRILDGLDPRAVSRIGDMAHSSPENVAIDADALEREMTILRQQEEWLAARRAPR